MQTTVEKLGEDQSAQLTTLLKVVKDLHTSTGAPTFAQASVEGEKVVPTEPTRTTPTPTQRLFGQLSPKRIASGLISTTMIITQAIPIQSLMPPPSTSALVLTTPISTEATTTTITPEATYNKPPASDKEKEIKVTGDSPPRLVPAKKEVRRNPDEPEIIEVTLHNRKIFRGTNEQAAAIVEEDEKIKAEMFSKSVIEKVAEEEIRDTDKPIKNEEFLKIQANLIKKHNETVRLLNERKKGIMIGMYGQ